MLVLFFNCHAKSFRICVLSLYHVDIISGLSKSSKPSNKVPVSLSASYTSTVAEEMVTLLCKLHALDNWNAVINTYITEKLRLIPDMVVIKPLSVSIFHDIITV